MLLRHPGRHALPATPRLHRLLGFAGCTTAALGAVVALTVVAAPAAQERPASPLVPVAAERGNAPTVPAPVRASRARALAGDDAAQQDPLPDCATEVAGDHANGQLPAEALCALPPEHGDHKLRPDAARALLRLGEAYEEWFEEPFCFTDSYRSLGSQQALAARKPGLAAVPGTSEHGWGLAIDFACGVESYDTPQHRWMIAHAGDFGWGQPDWAKDGGAREEPWHWEYLAAGEPSAPHDD